ncbi:MAG TPA: sodium:proton exchanger [Myxococcaceae bacterium]|nr:sodium:proton exchanger [Myxococcaceae bacterium]
MQALLLFLTVAALSVLASSPLLMRVGRAFGLAQLSASGLLFFVFGVAVGPLAMGVLDAAQVEALRPLIAIGLTVVGVLTGFNVEPRLLRSLPWRLYAAVVTQGATSLVVVAAGLFAVFYLTGALDGMVAALGAAALFGAVASVSSPHVGILGMRSGRLERREGLGLTLVAMLDDLWGLLALMAALALASAVSIPDGFGLLALAALLGLVCGLLLLFLTRAASNEEEVATLLLGAVMLVGGAAAYLRISTLVAGVVCGATLSVLGRQAAASHYKVLAKIERPVYLLLLFLAGPLFHPQTVWVWFVLPLFVVLRFVAKVAGGGLASRVGGGVIPPKTGWALVSQGGLSVCLVIEFLLLVPGPTSQLIFDVALLAALINEVLGARAFAIGFPPPARSMAPPAPEAN